MAQKLVYKEFDKFKVKQDKFYQSDFDNFINEVKLMNEGNDNNEKKEEREYGYMAINESNSNYIY